MLIISIIIEKKKKKSIDNNSCGWCIDPIIKSCTSVLNIQKSQLKN